MQPIALRCTYRYRGYSNAEIALLKQDLEGVAVLQSRPQGYPEAGNTYDMVFVAQFVGSSIVGGLIYDGLKEVGKALYRFYKRKTAASPDSFPPEIDLFELRFDDLDLRLRGKDRENMECNFLSDAVFEHLADLVTHIKEHLESEPLLSEDKLLIDVFEPEITLSETGKPAFNFQHPWRIVGVDVTGPKAYYANERILNEDHISLGY